MIGANAHIDVFRERRFAHGDAKSREPRENASHLEGRLALGVGHRKIIRERSDFGGVDRGVCHHAGKRVAARIAHVCDNLGAFAFLEGYPLLNIEFQLNRTHVDNKVAASVHAAFGTGSHVVSRTRKHEAHRRSRCKRRRRLHAKHLGKRLPVCAVNRIDPLERDIALKALGRKQGCGCIACVHVLRELDFHAVGIGICARDSRGLSRDNP